MPQGHSADAFRKTVLERFDMSLGSGLGKIQDKVYRIGHLGDFNDLMLMGTLAGVEMGLALADVPHRKGGVAAAMDRSEEHTSELQSLMRISYAVFCLKKKENTRTTI